VWEAYRSVKANKGAAGVDGQSIEDFEAGLRDNLYKIWSRMSSGTYFPPPVRAVEIPKPHGGGTRMLGVPTVADRIAQTVVALQLEPQTESIFHDDTYGYRPGRSPLDAVAGRRCDHTQLIRRRDGGRKAVQESKRQPAREEFFRQNSDNTFHKAS